MLKKFKKSYIQSPSTERPKPKELAERGRTKSPRVLLASWPELWPQKDIWLTIVVRDRYTEDDERLQGSRSGKSFKTEKKKIGTNQYRYVQHGHSSFSPYAIQAPLVCYFKNFFLFSFRIMIFWISQGFCKDWRRQNEGTTLLIQKETKKRNRGWMRSDTAESHSRTPEAWFSTKRDAWSIAYTFIGLLLGSMLDCLSCAEGDVWCLVERSLRLFYWKVS